MSTIKIGDHKYPVRFGIKFELEYEQTIKETWPPDYPTTEKTVKQIYMSLKNGAKKEGQPFDLTEAELIDHIDDDGSIVDQWAAALKESYTKKKDINSADLLVSVPETPIT